MDLRALKILVPERRVEVLLHDASGDAVYTLGEAPFHRVMEAAEPLLVRLAQEGGGPLQFLSIDEDAHALRATFLAEDGAEPGRKRERAERDLLHEKTGANMGEVGEVPPHVATLSLDGADYRHVRPLLREAARVAARAARPRRGGSLGSAERGGRSPAESPLIDLAGPAAADERALWEHKYLIASDGWELGRAAPPLQRYLGAHPVPGGARALVPGCGRGHEALLLAEAGAQVVAVDFAAPAVAETRRRAAQAGVGDRVEVLQEDALRLGPAHEGRYDLVLEHCCFCAVDPARRDEYVEAMARALRPDGTLLGLFWCHDYPGGPPWGSSRTEIEHRFSPRFELLHDEVPADSVLTRAGKELLALMRRRG